MAIDKQLNRAIHIIALGRVNLDPQTRVYLDRKQQEGKTKLEAIRCLKRHIARQIFQLLYRPQQLTQLPPAAPVRRVIAVAPGLMPCIR